GRFDSCAAPSKAFPTWLSRAEADSCLYESPAGIEAVGRCPERQEAGTKKEAKGAFVSMRWRRRSAPGLRTPGRLFVFARHAESEANVANALSSDPARPVALTEHGRQQARELGAQLTNLGVDLAVATRFLRTQQTIDIAL